MAQEGNVVATHVTKNGITCYIMDTYIRDVPEEEMKKRVEMACDTARRILEGRRARE